MVFLLLVITKKKKNESEGDLKVVHCTSADCSSHDTPASLETAGDVGTHTSIAIGNDTFPVISYVDRTGMFLKMIHCTSTNCSSFDPPITLDGAVLIASNLVMGIDGVTFTYATNDSLRLIHCSVTPTPPPVQPLSPPLPAPLSPLPAPLSPPLAAPLSPPATTVGEWITFVSLLDVYLCVIVDDSHKISITIE